MRACYCRIELSNRCCGGCCCCCWVLSACVLKRRTIVHIIVCTVCVCACAFPPLSFHDTLKSMYSISLECQPKWVFYIIIHLIFTVHTHRLHKRPRPSRLYTTAVAACTSTHISNAINERMNAGTHCNFCHAFFLSFFHCLAYSFVAVAVLCVIFLGANMMHSLQCVMKWWDRQQFFSHSVLLMFLDHVSFSAAAADSARQQCCMQPNWKLTHRGNQWDRKKLFFHSYE